MSLRSRLSLALALSAPFLCAGVAQGQTTPTTVSISLKNNNEGVVRGASYNPDYLRLNQFNQANCTENELVAFNIDIKGQASGYHLEAWIGTACDLRGNRVGSARSCRLIGEVGTNIERMEIWVRDMVGPLDVGGDDSGGTGGTAGTGGSAGTDTGGLGGTIATGGTDTGLGGTLGLGGTDTGLGGTFPTAGTDTGLGGTLATAGTLGAFFTLGGRSGNTGTAGTGISPLAETAGTGEIVNENGLEGPESAPGVQPITVCESEINTTPLDRTIYFVLVNGDGDFPGGAATGPTAKWPYNYDMGGPSAPLSVTAGIGESALVMKWTQASDAPIDLRQYVFLCDPPPGVGTADTGAAGAGGEGSGDEGSGAGPINELCTSAAFREDQVPSHDVIAKHLCGKVQSTTTEGEAGPLINGVQYTVGVASRDTYDNVGPVSNIVCGTPELVTDFFEAYRKAGGRGGGGFCAIGKVRSHALTTLFFLGALGLIVRRRTRARDDRRSLS